MEKMLKRKSSKTSLGLTQRAVMRFSDCVHTIKRCILGVCQCWPRLDELIEGHLDYQYQQVAYMIDRAFAGKASQAIMMLVVGTVNVVLAGFMYSVICWEYADWPDDPREEDSIIPYIEGVWHSWTFMADPGTHSDADRPASRMIAAVITICGIFFFAMVLGLVVDVIRDKMDSLRQGKSKIAEEYHVLCLGWTQQSIPIIEELCLAKESEGGGVIAILAERSKEYMETELSMQLPPRKRYGTRIVIRNGSPLLVNDLLRVGAHRAKAVLILAPVSAGPNEADANTVRAVLTLKTIPGMLRGFILAEVRDIDNEPLVRTVCDEQVEIVVSHDMIGRLMVMSVRQPGLAKVYEALLGFEGDEFYIEEWPEVVGEAFGDLQLFFPDAVPIGIITAEEEYLLDPPSGRRVLEGEQIVVIAADKNSYWPEERQAVAFEPPPARCENEAFVEKILICGWRRDVREILKMLDKIAQQGSEVHMITHCVPVAQREKALLEDGFHVGELRNVRLVHHFGNTSVRRQLDKLPLETFTSGMIFAESAFELDPMYADSHSLATLLLLRDIQVARVIDTEVSTVGPDMVFKKLSSVDRLAEDLHAHGAMLRCPVVCEILSPQTQATISQSKQLSSLSDFCQTNRLIAQVMAMITEERAVKRLLDQLLGCYSANIAVVPAERYAKSEERVSFYQLSQRASCYNEVLLGYQQRNTLGRTVLNPPNKEKPYRWDQFDFAVLQSQEDIECASLGLSSTGSVQLRMRANVRQSTQRLMAGATADDELASNTFVGVYSKKDQSDFSSEDPRLEIHQTPSVGDNLPSDKPPEDLSSQVEGISKRISQILGTVGDGSQEDFPVITHTYSSEYTTGEQTHETPDSSRDDREASASYDPDANPLLRESLACIAQLPQIPETENPELARPALKAVMQQMPVSERKKIRESLSVMQEALSLADRDVAYTPSHLAQESIAQWQRGDHACRNSSGKGVIKEEKTMSPRVHQMHIVQATRSMQARAFSSGVGLEPGYKD